MTRKELLEIIRKAEGEQAVELDLSMCGITELPEEIGHLKNLKELNLSHNKLKELPKEIVQFKNLIKLYLRYNQLDRLPEEIVQLKNLTILVLSHNRLNELAEEVTQLKNLSILDLSSNQLSELPEKIAELKNLSMLDLSSNQLSELPEKIAQLKNLTTLNLNFNQLNTLPEEIGQLANLSQLYSSFNKLSELPKEIVQLKNLIELDLSSNQLSKFPKEIVQLKNLTQLHLMDNQLNELPKEIAQLKNLTTLYLMDNNLKLPKEIAQLKNLTTLYLSNNKLAKLPEGITDLRNLSILNLSFNQLSELPKEIAQLKNLTQLYLMDNRLSKLPKEFLYLKKLEHLDIDENPLIFPPIEVVSQGLPAIMDYLKKSDKDIGQTLYETKLLIVGQGGVGKTCLIKRLISDEYPGEQATTEGIDIQKWEITAPDRAKTRMTLNVWDFGGQEIYHATHQFFLTQRSLYIFAWDARQEEEYGRIDYWLNTVETFAADSPILIIMNKSDERTKDLNLKDLRQRFPQIVASGKVSAKKGTGIRSLRQFIAKQARKLPLMGTLWPSSWLAVRRALEKTPRFHVPYQTYLQVCEKAGIKEKEAGTLSRYLHDLGIILHFQDDILLKDTIIIRPEWGTDAVYKVLDAKPVRERNGVLYDTDLPEIWSDRKLYPPDRYAVILRLMANFELAFPFGDGNGHIVAELLSPKDVEYDWKPPDPLQFEYHYEFLPAGIITRLIVRMHEFLIRHEGRHLCWREGAYFEYEGSQAVVRINPYTRIAVIQIQGPAKREFLAIIRSHFAAIHKTIRKIRFRERIPCICAPECGHRFDYNVLLKCEKKNKRTVMCEKTIEDVSVERLLDGIERAEIRRRKTGEENPSFRSVPPPIPESPPHIEDGKRLAAIMFTDIVGFSKKVEKNEEKTLKLLFETHFKTMRSIIRKHHGTEIKTIGDAFMVMFPSAGDAVKCAVEIQESHNKEILTPRIGIHIGDLIFKDGDAFGDSVNIAARIEPLADPGGICISEDVFSIVKKRMALEMTKLENVVMKNINDPPAVYKVILESEVDNVVYLSRKK
ncbi:COR domain-containing protein [Desulfobacterales bacterium HSG2]|nr:COR domain-containing protein [Desulfobacterales bacterium HSG2]